MATKGIKICGSDFLAWEDKKDPDSIKDYALDLSDEGKGGYLDGATISSIVSVSVESGSGLIVGDGSNGKPIPTTDGTTISFWLIVGGNIGNWEVTIRFTTSDGLTDDVTRIIQVDQT